MKPLKPTLFAIGATLYLIGFFLLAALPTPRRLSLGRVRRAAETLR